MLSDNQSKLSLTTFNSEQKCLSMCEHIDNATLKAKLIEILETLQSEIRLKEKELDKMRALHAQTLIEKDEIIQRLVSANSKLIIQNQSLNKKLCKSAVLMKSSIKAVEQEYQIKIRQMEAYIISLQSTNKKLLSEVSKKSYLKSEAFHPSAIVSNSPYMQTQTHTIRSIKVTYQPRTSHVLPSYKTKNERLSPKIFDYPTYGKDGKRDEKQEYVYRKSRNSRNIVDDQYLIQKRPKSTKNDFRGH